MNTEEDTTMTDELTTTTESETTNGVAPDPKPTRKQRPPKPETLEVGNVASMLEALRVAKSNRAKEEQAAEGRVRATINDMEKALDALYAELGEEREPAVKPAVTRPRVVGKPAPAKKARATKAAVERLPRRKPEDIEADVVRVVDLVAKHEKGLRSEEIRDALGIDKRALPAILKSGLAAKVLKSKGEKRATTYFAR